MALSLVAAFSAITFVSRHYNGEIPEGYEVHHKNGNKTDNRIQNLKLLTWSEHSKLHNELRRQFKTHKPGEFSP